MRWPGRLRRSSAAPYELQRPLAFRDSEVAAEAREKRRRAAALQIDFLH
jgi:hypothetical protein